MGALSPDIFFETQSDGTSYLSLVAGKVRLRRIGFGAEYSIVSGESRSVVRNILKKIDRDGDTTRFDMAIDEEANLHLSVSVAQGKVGLRIRCELANRGAHPVRVTRIMPFACDANLGSEAAVDEDFRRIGFFKNGWQSWSATRMFRLDERDRSPWLPAMRVMQENPANRGEAKPGCFVSEQMTLLGNRDTGLTLALGFMTGRTGFGDIRLRCGKNAIFQSLIASHHADGLELAPGATLAAEDFWLGIFTDAGEAAEAWASLFGREMKARTPSPAPVGWCSWYYYMNKIDEPEMLRNLSILSDLRDRLPVTLVQLDDGYQSEIGDWLAHNLKFPSGISTLMGKIKENGFQAGIWTAPFLARPQSMLFHEYPDWFLRDATGKPVSGGINPIWGGRVYALDPTHPAARRYLHQVFHTMRKDWGVDFFKIDFCYAAALPARRHDPKTTRAQALRIGLETIRDAIGDAFLLGCGCPLGPAVGIVDAMRISCDVTPKWDNNLLKRIALDPNVLCTRHALRNIMTRAFMNGRLWINDPDCLMIRRKKSKLTDDEVNAVAATYLATGGLINISDDMSLVDLDRIELAAKTMIDRTNGARTLDLMSERFPSTALAKTADGHLLLIANWSDKKAAKSVELKRLAPGLRVKKAVDYRSGGELPIEDGRIELGLMPPHSTRLLRLT